MIVFFGYCFDFIVWFRKQECPIQMWPAFDLMKVSFIMTIRIILIQYRLFLATASAIVFKDPNAYRDSEIDTFVGVFCLVR